MNIKAFILGIGVNGTLGANLKINRTKVFLVSFYLNNNPKKFFNFMHFPGIADQKTGQKPNFPNKSQKITIPVQYIVLRVTVLRDVLQCI